MLAAENEFPRPPDQAAWLAARDLDYAWPARGLPRLMHSDRAEEFTSSVANRLEKTARNYLAVLYLVAAMLWMR